ncbi:HAD-IIIC family phosphatase [Nocardia brasiliensis]|uniref:HAD-IIIC family phosphatase n=1 Tax=Nocardia brasiliensis TaxID=37326 RepID=UPI001894FCED|nr:HAD-IIIC family phosphatase [Nocardia brasiliensis]MBF6130916.1 HAD-IIIC family phosphatase [Nocardia brasiliensis]
MADIAVRIAPADGYVAWTQHAKTLAREPNPPGVAVRLAVLATYTTDFLTELLPLACARAGVTPELLEFPFGQVEQVLLAPQTPFREGDYVVLAGTHHDVTGSVEETVDRWVGLWDAAARSGVRVVQLGFAPPAVDAYGAAAWRTPQSLSHRVREINARLAEQATGRVLFVDVEQLAAQVGLRQWEDSRSWYRVRQPYAPDSLPWLAAAIADTVAADRGRSVRCVVVDLDGTLWGGVLGDDGIDGIRVGTGAEGEAFADFQRYLRALTERGVLLAVASKNDRELALRAIDEAPGMVLRAADFTHIVADWRPKSEQLQEISQKIRLGLGSIAFVDDNPAECAQVVAAHPEVRALCLPAAPAKFRAALAALPWLHPGALSSADFTRQRSYQALAAAEQIVTDNLDEFLASLDMIATIEPINSTTLDRAAQLIAKTNQFNLTTRRHTQSQVRKMAEDPRWFAAILRLRDRFADHGIVGVLLAEDRDDAVEIDTLLLSCRVIGRNAENNLLAAAAEWALAQGSSRLVGRYLPTARNALVRELYPRHGFALEAESAQGAVYGFDLTGGAPARSPHVREAQTQHGY